MFCDNDETRRVKKAAVFSPGLFGKLSTAFAVAFPKD